MTAGRYCPEGLLRREAVTEFYRVFVPAGAGGFVESVTRRVFGPTMASFAIPSLFLSDCDWVVL